MRFALTDGVLDIPVHAKSRDEVETRQVNIEIKRRTESEHD
ncbi:MAG: hypothetical protein ABIG11_05830 [bacterium]